MVIQNLQDANDVVIDSLKSRSGPISSSPSDWRDQFIYFLLVDRFSDGNNWMRHSTFPSGESWKECSVDNHDQIGRSPRSRFLYHDPFQGQAILAVGYLLASLGVPCIYYGTEQGFDGGGDSDKYIRECMFGSKWGAFNTTGHHFFNPDHPIYHGISRIAAIRQKEPALRYGRQYFREISGNGFDFGYPMDGRGTLAYSRILDETEILIALNLDAAPRNDFLTVDSNLTPSGKRMVNLLQPETSTTVQVTGQRHAVRIGLRPHEMAILKLLADS